jgi:plasmid replication initiation protein
MNAFTIFCNINNYRVFHKRQNYKNYENYKELGFFFYFCGKKEKECFLSDMIPPANTPETLGVNPRYVLQHNAVSRSIHHLSATAKKVIALAMALLPFDLSTRAVSFKFTEFCSAFGLRHEGGKSYRVFRQAVTECMKNIISIEIPDKNGKKGKWEQYTWFSYAAFDEETGACAMTFSEELASVLLELKKAYAKMNLIDLGRLRSKYAIRYFEIGTSFSSLAGKDGNKKDKWYFEYTIADLRMLFAIPPEEYRRTDVFRKKVVEDPLKELNNAGVGMEIRTEGVKEGRGLKALRFNCVKTNKTADKTRRTKAQFPAPAELPLIDEPETREDKEMEHLKELYPAEFAALYREELEKYSLLPGKRAAKISAELAALKTLREKHGIVK